MLSRGRRRGEGGRVGTYKIGLDWGLTQVDTALVFATPPHRHTATPPHLWGRPSEGSRGAPECRAGCRTPAAGAFRGRPPTREAPRCTTRGVQACRWALAPSRSGGRSAGGVAAAAAAARNDSYCKRNLVGVKRLLASFLRRKAPPPSLFREGAKEANIIARLSATCVWCLAYSGTQPS